MTTEQFVYWLQGYCELSPDNPPNKAQWKMIQEHLALAFNKATPPLDIEIPSSTFPISPAGIPQPFCLKQDPYNPITVTC